MKIIGIDASRANRALKTGVERYCFEIIGEILRQRPEDWHVRLYLDQPVRKDVAVFVDAHADTRHLRWPPRVLWTQTRLAWETFRRRPDLLFVPGHVLPALHSRPAATVVHDVAFVAHPEGYTPHGRFYLMVTTWLAARTADRIIVPSAAVKDDLLRTFPAKGLAERIRIVPHGVSVPAPLADGECAMVRAKLGLRQPYALMLGRVEAKKNVARAVQALALVRKEHPDLQLALIGRPGAGYDRMRPSFAGQPWAMELGPLPDRETFALLQGASLLLFPSLAEGFGLPILEAFSYGVPVVTSKGSATEEVAGGLAHLVDPSSSESIADGIRRALTETDPAVAEQRRAHAAAFTWSAAAQKTIAVLKELL
ncbi:glycosyltransferase family 1 protein [Patescibacteria group bacterium]|nr:MAG: glycosyltransferase family 1 protein [Patescibacteria group bacterium]